MVLGMEGGGWWIHEDGRERTGLSVVEERRGGVIGWSSEVSAVRASLRIQLDRGKALKRGEEK